MTPEQLRLVSWLYNFAIINMIQKVDKYTESDQIKLKEAIYRRFPEHEASQIVKKMTSHMNSGY